jgi:OPA family glycerol-3-phosphate transporter-like MFS transporter
LRSDRHPRNVADRVHKLSVTDQLIQEVVPIAILCVVVVLVVRRLPRVDVGHTNKYRLRRALNWLPLGLTYALLYMGRYNLTQLMVLKLITPQAFGGIDAIGAAVYGIAFFFNGPLTDRLGGRFAILLGAAGAAISNGIIGIMIYRGGVPSTSMLTLLFALNMYFQSFGAVAIVKVNASWFHIRERGTFGGIFGILISLGIYLSLDWAPKIADIASLPWLFLAPAVGLAVFWVICVFYVRDLPSDAGFPDFDVADASSGSGDAPEGAKAILKRLLTSRVVMTLALVTLCTGFLSKAILKWFRTFAQGVGSTDSYIFVHWGMVLCIAGITGGMIAGLVSDHLFKSRRPPVATWLFVVMLAFAIAIVPLLRTPLAVNWVVAFMAIAVQGVNGMLAGVASQDFGGRKAAGTATGLIDGFAYMGTAAQSYLYGVLLPSGAAAKDIGNWYSWPLAMIPVAIIGLALAASVYNAQVTRRAAAH